MTTTKEILREVTVPLLDRFRARHTDNPPVPVTAQQLRVIRADGARIDLTARDAGTRLTLTRQEWQTDAWTYRDMIGELRFAQRFLAHSVSDARFYAAEFPTGGTAPIELTTNDHGIDPKLAADAVTNLERLPLDEGPEGFVSMLVENLETAGEAWIHGERDGNGGETWSIRSVSEIVGTGDQVMLAEIPNSTTLGQRPIDPQQEELLRCWTRHPRWGQLADSPLRAMLDVLEEVVLTGREMRAASRSRIASNGVLLIPDSLVLLRTRQDDEDLVEQGALDNDFMADFTEALTAPIRNEGDAGSVVPLLLRGNPEALKEVRHLTLSRADPEQLMERLNGAILRMLQGLDIQPEQVQGMGASNHWTGWQIEASNVRHQVLPTCGISAGCFTKAFLRPALISMGHDPQQVRRVGVWYDASNVVESPDRSQDARDAWDRNTIKDEALREALGFTEDDAPEPVEYLLRVLSRGQLPPQAIPLVAAMSGVDLRDKNIQDAMTIAMGLGTGAVTLTRPALPSESPSQSGGSTARAAQPNQVVPEQTAPTPPQPGAAPPAAAVTAAGGPVGWRVDIDAGRALAAVDASLMEQILTAADAAVARAVERAGGRAKNHTRRDAAVVASLVGVDAVLVPGVVGREKLVSFVSVADLLAGAYTRFAGQFDRWLTAAARAAVDVALRLMGIPPGSPLGRRFRDVTETRYAANRSSAWLAMQGALDTAAERAMFRADPMSVEQPDRGERSDTLVSPSAVANVLGIAGGGDPSGASGARGFGVGPVMMDSLTESGGVLLGWEWQYHPERPRGSHFLPHQVLDGARFSTWTDPKLDTTESTRDIGLFFHPQDHPGCRCSAAPIVGYPEVGPDEDPDDIVGRRLREARDSDRGRLAARVAAEDTAAGRIGTTLQQETEVRDRLITGVEQLRAHYIGG